MLRSPASVCEFDREADGGRHQAGVRFDESEASAALSAGGVSRSSLLEMAQAHEPDVAEGLREVAQELSADRIDLLSEQADVADEGGGSFEHGARSSRLSGQGKGLGQPEGADKECAFLALERVGDR
jgi:hypothetical protein